MTNKDGHNTDMENAAIDNNDFDLFLRKQLQSEKNYIDDVNFTAQVIARLPVAKKLIGWQERLIIAVPLIIISLLVLSQNSLLASIIKAWVLLSVISVESLFEIILLMSVAALFSVGYWFARKNRLFIF